MATPNNPIYELFDKFLKETIICQKSLFSGQPSISGQSSIFSSGVLVEIEGNFVKGVSKTNFKDNITTQFQNASDEAKELFTHLIWLRYLPILDVSTKTKCEMISLWNTSYKSSKH